jgi:Holliday junction resolvase RusA-like endonuclease
MTSLSLFAPMEPPTTTHQMKQVRVVGGKPRFYEPAAVADARAKLIAHLAKHRPEAPLEGPVELRVDWLFPLCGDHCNGDYRTSKPDTDNLQKLLKDVMTRLGYWTDDAQVAREMVQKLWSKTPGIYIAARELTT